MTSPHPLVARLVDGRIGRGWTQAAAAHRMGVTRTRLAQWECGRNRMPVEWLAVYAAVVGLRVELAAVEARPELGEAP